MEDIPGYSEDLARVTTYEQARTLVLNKAAISQEFSHYESMMITKPYLRTYITEAASATKYKEISAIQARLMKQVVSEAGPLPQQVYMLSKKFILTMRSFMRSDVNVARLKDKYNRYIPENAPEDFDSTDYMLALANFRELPIFKLPNGNTIPGFEVIRSDVEKTLAVNEGSLSSLNNMLQLMINERNKNIPGRAKKVGNGAPHARHILNELASNNPIYEVDVKKKNKSGYSLMATALANGIQFGNDMTKRFELLYKKNDREFYNSVMDELDNLGPKKFENAASPFIQQRMNIDPVFLTFFFIFAILDVDLENFVIFQKLIFKAGKVLRGRERLVQFFTLNNNIPYAAQLLTKLSQCTDIHLPPIMMNTNRMQEMFAVLGGCVIADTSTITESCVSWRHMVNVKSPLCIDIAIACFEIEHSAFNAGDAADVRKIYQSLHMFHQLLLRRTSPFQNTNWVKGNALNVNLILDE